MKTLPEIDAILRDALNKARGAQRAETLEAARQRAAGAGTLVTKARAALAEWAANEARIGSGSVTVDSVAGGGAFTWSDEWTT